MYPTPKPQACCSTRLPVEIGSALANMQHTLSKAPSAHPAGSPTRQRRTGCGNANTTVLSTSRHAPSSKSVRQDRDLPDTLDQGLVPGQFLHHFPAPEDTPLFGCKEAAVSDLITPRQGERMLVGFGETSGGRYASDTRHRRVGTAAIIMDFPGTEWSDIDNLPIQQLLNTTGPTQHDTEEDHANFPTEPLSMRLHEAFYMRAGWMQVLPGAPQTTPRASFGRSFSLSLAHEAPSYILPTTWGWSQGFTQTAISFRPGLWRNFGIKLVNS